MKTFNNCFRDFNKKYSYVELFLQKTYSDKSVRIFKWISIPCGILFLTGDILMMLKIWGNLGYWLMLISCLPIIIYVFVIQTYLAKKELKSKGLPKPKNIPANWFKWTSPELEDLRIKVVFQSYEKQAIKDETIENLIKIGYQEYNEPIKDPFVFFEKLFEYIGKTFLGILIGFLIAELNNNYSTENFNSTLRLIIGLLLMAGLFAYMWKFMFKRAYFENIVSRKEKLKEFVFALNNILLLRKQNR
ncbi:MAG: hypothetical protein HRT67_01945 [Flavobacteriaceae bacterium]|nr:hypothetical protein [Flavobacteriaceae bacterium]